MTLTPFDPINKLHQDLFQEFKQDLICDNYSKDHLYCKLDECIDNTDHMFRHIAVGELGLDPDIIDGDNDWHAVLTNEEAFHFGVIICFEYVEGYSDKMVADFIKLSGNIYVEDDKLIILDIDFADIDYSTEREFWVAQHK